MSRRRRSHERPYSESIAAQHLRWEAIGLRRECAVSGTARSGSARSSRVTAARSRKPSLVVKLGGSR